jgi:hypothetical protein
MPADGTDVDVSRPQRSPPHGDGMARRWSKHARALPFVALLACAVLAADYFTGPSIQFPILFIAPVALAAWFHGRNWGLAFAGTLPLVHMGISFAHKVPWSLLDVEINAGIRLVVLILFALLTDQAAQRRKLAEEVKVLRGLLPICCFCKKIRNTEGTWEVMEQYIADRSEAEFSHGLCASCARKHYGVDVQE